MSAAFRIFADNKQTLPMTSTREIELLAPARNAEIAIQAIRHGADAVYIGAGHHGARAAAGNSITDISRVVEYAHRFDARVYVTTNTIIYDNELREVEQLIHRLYRIGVDALIVQDMALLRMDIPPIALHASTQCDTRTPEKARFLQDAGFSQIVIARELSLPEIRSITDAVTVPVEAFVHGALCVSYSGDCQASWAVTGRSANRGECAQMCRLPYDLVDGGGNTLLAGRHLLSLRDMNRLPVLAEMMQAGVSSFKIEGRLKDETYVKNVVAAYRQALDRIISANPDRYRRASRGQEEYSFVPDVSRSFNRGFTDYFLTDRQPAAIATLDTPKSTGAKVATTVSSKGRQIKIKASAAINNGDGLGYFDRRGRFTGFRVNRAEGNTLYAAADVDIPAGADLYRNRDTAFDAAIKGDTARRTIPVRMTLRAIGKSRVALDIDDGMRQVTAATEVQLSEARTPQAETRRRTLAKTGDTVYTVTEVTDRAGNLFIPASALAALRRQAIDLLERAARTSYRYDYRRPETPAAGIGTTLTYHDNVSNGLAEKFYREHGVTAVSRAAETMKRPEDGMRVMLTRYCLRRELGHCLKTPSGPALKSPLYLRSAGSTFRLEFDCRRCEMSVIYLADNKINH